MNQLISLHEEASDQYEIPIYWSTNDSFYEENNLVSEENFFRIGCVASQNIDKPSNSPVKHDLSLENWNPDDALREISNGFFSLDENSRVSCLNIEMNAGVQSEYCSEYANAVAGPSGILPSMINKTDKEIFVCSLCRKKFANSWEFGIHYQTHADKKPFAWEVCEEPFVREVCQKEFTQKNELEKNYRTHAGGKPFVCKVCLKVFSCKRNLGRHYRTHTGEKPFECKVCLKVFSRKCNLGRHYRTHTGEKPFACDICKRNFTQKAHLHHHYKTHSYRINFV